MKKLTKPTKRRSLPRSGDERESKKQAIIERLQTTGETITASALACGVPLGTLYRWRAEDQSFKAQLRDAYDAGTDVLEQEAIRRGLHGVERPVFFQGKEAGSVREYSDNLLMFVLKKRNPAFRENTPGLDGKDPVPREGTYIGRDHLDAFSPALRAMLRQELENIERRRRYGEPLAGPAPR